MHHFLFVTAALGTLALSLVSTGASAAPLLGSKAIAAAAAPNIEPVFFFRCGIFGQRCRYNRDRFDRR